MHKAPALWGLVSFLLGLGAQVSGYTNVYLTLACLVLAGVLMLVAARDLIFERLNRNIPLSNASRIAFDSLRNSKIGKIAIENHPGDPLSFIATELFCSGVPVYGMHKASGIRTRIPDDALFAGQFSNDATELIDKYSKQPEYSDLSVKKKELLDVVRAISASG